MSVAILVPERESVVALTSTSICESTAEPIVVVAVVVLSTSILAVVVLTIVVLAIVVGIVLTIVVLTIVLSIVIIGGITAASTVVGSPTKQIVEEPFVPSILSVFGLPSLPASVAGAGAPCGKEEPCLTILSLAFATFAARVARVAVQGSVQGTSNCRSKDGSTEGTNTSAHKASVQSFVAREKPCVCVQGSERELLRR